MKFAGCYHGHSDALLAKAGSGLLTLGIPNSPGVPAAVAELTLTLPFNDTAAIDNAFESYGDRIAGVILEPVAGNMGCVPPLPGYLEHLRAVTERHGALLIFDEVITGFRVAPGGAQEKFGVTPDLTTLGKIIGGGLPIGAFGGRREIMEHIAPLGDVYQAGTLSGNPIAVAAGTAMLNALSPALYQQIDAATQQLTDGLLARARAAGLEVCANQTTGLMSLFFERETVSNFDDVAGANVQTYQKFFHHMLDEGIYLAPSAFEVAFLSAAHDDTVIGATLDAAERAFAKLR